MILQNTQAAIVNDILEKSITIEMYHVLLTGRFIGSILPRPDLRFMQLSAVQPVRA